MAIIGTGDIAQAIIDHPQVIFFCSGVSNSQCTDTEEFERERALLLRQPKQHLVYISTLAVYYGESMYVQHKRVMENLVRYGFPSYTIVRIGNITWGSNPHTLINYLRAHPEAPVQQTYRYLLDKEEFQHWLLKIRVGQKDEMNITGRMTWVPDLAASIKAESVKSIYAHGPKY